MDRDEAKEEIRRLFRCTEYLTKSKNDPAHYDCPLCGSGEKENRTGAVTYYPKENKWYCYACHNGGDVIDLHMITRGVDYNAALQEMAREAGITIDSGRPARASDHGGQRATKPGGDHSSGGPGNPPLSAGEAPGPEGADKEVNQQPAADYTAYYAKCNKRLRQSTDAKLYLQRRGISVETAARLGIGYDESADPAAAPGAMDFSDARKRHPRKRIIIPTGKSHYVGRRADGGKEYAKINCKGGSPGIFNLAAIYDPGAGPVFVTEGAFDALSVEQAGHKAIALNSAGNYEALVERARERKPEAALILCPDNDSDPKTAAGVKEHFATLEKELRALGVDATTADINGTGKDANEHLVNNPDTFLSALLAAEEQAKKEKERREREEQQERERRQEEGQADRLKTEKQEKQEQEQKQQEEWPYLVSDYIGQEMGADIKDFKEGQMFTGFSNLDRMGGIYSGLYILAAVPGLGKTTFIYQLAEQIADGVKAKDENGKEITTTHDVIFYSLEQSRLELVSKSLARRIAIDTMDKNNRPDREKAISGLSIRLGNFPEKVEEAARRFQCGAGKRFSIIESRFNVTVTRIENDIKSYIERTGKRPLVIIDYLQALRTEEADKRLSLKEITDEHMKRLVTIAKREKITIIAISSMNRAGYLDPISFESLKESGNIEYTADAIWGLQLQVLNDEDFPAKENEKKQKRKMLDKAKSAVPRKVEFISLKGRSGKPIFSCYFDYYPAYDLFLVGEKEEEKAKAKEKAKEESSEFAPMTKEQEEIWEQQSLKL